MCPVPSETRLSPQLDQSLQLFCFLFASSLANPLLPKAGEPGAALVIWIRRGVKSRRDADTCPCGCTEEVLHFVLRHLTRCPGCRGALTAWRSCEGRRRAVAGR